jgi:hypothetical protein
MNSPIAIRTRQRLPQGVERHRILLPARRTTARRIGPARRADDVVRHDRPGHPVNPFGRLKPTTRQQRLQRRHPRGVVRGLGRLVVVIADGAIDVILNRLRRPAQGIKIRPRFDRLRIGDLPLQANGIQEIGNPNPTPFLHTSSKVYYTKQ